MKLELVYVALLIKSEASALTLKVIDEKEMLSTEVNYIIN